jgi:glycosyltransferase involved in cell wall biosynthesis
VHDDNVVLADGEEAFADAVIRLMRDRRLGIRLADGGRSTVERHYDWRTEYTAFDGVYTARPRPHVAQVAG